MLGVLGYTRQMDFGVAIGYGRNGRRPVRLAGGRQASALDIQREYYTRAVEHLQTREPNAQIEQVSTCGAASLTPSRARISPRSTPRSTG